MEDSYDDDFDVDASNEEQEEQEEEEEVEVQAEKVERVVEDVDSEVEDVDSDDGDDDGEETLEVQIAQEHEVFRRAQAQWQERVRAARPWSAPPLGSPSLQEQRQREAQSQVLHAAVGLEGAAAAIPRSEYRPPERPFLDAKAGRGGGASLSHLAPPRPTSADSYRSMYRSSTASSAILKSGLLQDIMEDSPLESPGGFNGASKTKAPEADFPFKIITPAHPALDATERAAEGAAEKLDDSLLDGGDEDGSGSCSAATSDSGDTPRDAIDEAGLQSPGSSVHEDPFKEETKSDAAGCELEMSFGELGKVWTSDEGAALAAAAAMQRSQPAAALSLSFTLLPGGQPESPSAPTPSALGMEGSAACDPRSSPAAGVSSRLSRMAPPATRALAVAEATEAAEALEAAEAVATVEVSNTTAKAVEGVSIDSKSRAKGEEIGNANTCASNFPAFRVPTTAAPVPAAATAPAGVVEPAETDSSVASPTARTPAEQDGQTDVERASSNEEEEEDADYGDMLAPHAFALQLLAHDLRTLPAAEPLGGALRSAAPAAPPRVPLSQYGFLGLQLPDAGARRASPERGLAVPGALATARPAAGARLRPATAPARRSSPLKQEHSWGAHDGILRNSRYVTSAKQHRPPPPPQADPAPGSSGHAALAPPPPIEPAWRAGTHGESAPPAPATNRSAGPAPQTTAAAPSGRRRDAGKLPLPAGPGWGRAEVAAMSGVGPRDAAAGTQQQQRPAAPMRPSSAGPAYRGPGGAPSSALSWSGPVHAPGYGGHRPMSAQPIAGGGRHAEVIWEASRLDADADAGRPGSAGGQPTAAVSVGGRNVSVYVADVTKRIMECNRWMGLLGLACRHRLKNPHSNMQVQLVGEEPSSAGGGCAGVRVLRTMSLKQFLAVHKDLKTKVAALAAQQQGGRPGELERTRQAGARAEAGGGGAAGGLRQGAGRQRPWSAAPGGGGGGQKRGSGVVLSGVRVKDCSDGYPHALYEVTPSGVSAGNGKAQHLQRVTAAAQRCHELAEQVNLLRQYSEAWHG